MLTLNQVPIADDSRLPIVRRDLSGGINTRQHGANLAENQATVLYNADIGIAGETAKRPGSVQIANDVSNDNVIALHNYERQGYNDNLIEIDGQSLRANEAEAATWSNVKTNFTASLTDYGICQCKESGLTPDDIIIVQNGTDNAIRLHKDSTGTWNEQDLGDTNTSPPKTTVMGWYGNRVWCLKNDLLYYGDAYSADYSGAYDRTTESFRIPVGAERAIIPLRDKGMLVAGQNAIWGFFPLATPAATDRPEPFITGHGFVSKKGWCIAGDEVYYFAQDGLRAFTWTATGTLTQKSILPISYPLEDEFASISWAYIDRLCMVYFDNKIFITVPTGASSFDTWVFYPAYNSFMVIQGWSPRSFARYKVSGAERLYYGKHGNGVVYRAWTGYTDEGTTSTNGTAINYQEEGRKEDFGQPLVKKSGGTLRIKAYSSGNYNLTVSASADDLTYSSLGTMNLAGNAPTLPVALPFNLANQNLIEETFHLDGLGEFYQLRIKIQHNAVNGSDDVKIFERAITTYPMELQDE